MVEEDDIISALKQVASSITGLKGEISALRGGDPMPPPSAAGVDVPEVHAQLAVRRIFNVDNISQTFGAQLMIRMLWKMPDSETPPGQMDADWEPQWYPKFRIRRVMEEKAMIEQFNIRMVDGVNYVELERDYLVDIYEQLELQSFPVDVQDLRISIISLMPTDSVKWVPWRELDKVCTIQKELVALNDFALLEEVPVVYTIKTIKIEEVFCALVCDVKVARRANYYMMNVAPIILAIASFTLCSWSLHPADIAGRHGCDFALILTAVAFKLILASLLPKVSYITLMDVYVWGCFLFIATATICHTLLPFRYTAMDENSPLTYPPENNESEEALIEGDRIALFVFIALWAAFNVIYFSYMFIHGRMVFWSYVKTAKEEQAQNIKDLKALAKNGWVQDKLSWPSAIPESI